MQKPMFHNRLVRLWGNPSRQKFKDFYRSTHGLFDDQDDAQNMVKYGAYLIVKGNKQVLDIQPYDRSKGLENWIGTIEGDILFHVGIEYFIKGLYLHLGYSINKAKDPRSLIAPYKIKGNKAKLDPSETHTLAYFINHIDDLINFSDFDKQQAAKNKQPKPGPRSMGLISTTYKHPMHSAILDYMKVSRDKYLHTSKKLPEFRGVTDEVMEILNYMASSVCNKKLKELADLKTVYF